MEGIDRTGQSTSAADGRFLGPSTNLNSSTGIFGAGKVKKKRVIIFRHQSSCNHETVIALNKYFGLSDYVRRRNRRNLLLVALASFEHVGEIELDGPSGRGRIFTATDAVYGLTKNRDIPLFTLSDCRFIFSVLHNF